MNLEEIIKNTIIQKAGPIGFDEFMDLALYYPAQGYYSGGAQKFGEQGDRTGNFEWNTRGDYC